MLSRSGPDNRWLAILFALGLAGVLIVFLFHDRGVPIASIDFKVRQPEATSVAADYLKQQGIDVSGFQSAVSFETDTDAQGYVERTAGQRELDQTAREEATVWRWSVRFFHELDPLEYDVSVLPDGRVAGWQRTVAEAAPGASLTEDEALKLAESAPLPALAAGDDRVWTPAGTVQETRPGRVDYTFTWERQGFSIGEATQRRWVLIQGNEIAGTGDYLKIPETWTRDQRIETNRGIVLATAGWTLTYGIIIAAGAFFLFEWRAGRTRRRVPIFLIITLLVVGILALVNQLPVFVSGYPTTASMTGYLLGQVRDQASMLVPEIIAVAIAAAAGIPLWRRAFPNSPDPGRDLSFENIRTGRFIPALAAGYAAAGIWLGYFTLYYLIGTSFFNVWSPVELPYRDVMSGAFPAAFPLFIGASAAFTEETVFRLFALPAGFNAAIAIWTRLRGAPPSTRSRRVLLAIVIVGAAMIWGSLHSTYPQQPFFIRALEVGLVGIMAGIVVLRWGIVATIATHYIGNTAIVGMLFLLSGNRDLEIAAIVVVALPLLLLLPYAVSRLRGARPAMSPVMEEPAPALPAAPANIGVESRPAGTGLRLPPRLLFPIVAAMAIGAAVLGIPAATNSLVLGTTRSQAETIARSTLDEIGATKLDWIVLSSFVDATRGAEGTYLLRTVGPAATEAFYDHGAPIPYPSGYWQLRFSRPLQKEEISVQVDPDGRVIGYNRAIDEAAPGASPSQDNARKIAEQILAKYAGSTDGWNLVSASQTKRDARLDSTFVWERQGFKEGDATLRVQVGLLGVQPGSVHSYLKLPETFLRDLNRETGIEGLLGTARDLMSIVVVVGGAILFLSRFRARRVNIESAAKVTCVVAACWLLALIAGLPSLLAGYLNTLDLAGFAVYQISLQLRQGLLLFSAVFAVAAIVLEARQQAPADEETNVLARWNALKANVAFAVVGTIALISATLLIPGIRAAVAPSTLRPVAALPPIDAYVPALALIGGDVVTALAGAFGLLAIIAIFDRFVRFAPLKYALIVLAAALYFAADGRGLTDIALSAAFGAAAAVIALLLWTAHGRPTAGVFLAIITALALRDAYELARVAGGDPFLIANAALMLAAMVTAWALTLRRISAGTLPSGDLLRPTGSETHSR
jgi:hypothetical protein